MTHMDGWAWGCSLAWTQRHRGRPAPINILTSYIGNCIINTQRRECLASTVYRPHLLRPFHLRTGGRSAGKISRYLNLSHAFTPSAPKIMNVSVPGAHIYYSQLTLIRISTWQLLKRLLSVISAIKVKKVTKKRCCFNCSPKSISLVMIWNSLNH